MKTFIQETLSLKCKNHRILKAASENSNSQIQSLQKTSTPTNRNSKDKGGMQ